MVTTIVKRGFQDLANSGEIDRIKIGDTTPGSTVAVLRDLKDLITKYNLDNRGATFGTVGSISELYTTTGIKKGDIYLVTSMGSAYMNITGISKNPTDWANITSAGISTFLGLTDTPNAYTDGQLLRAKQNKAPNMGQGIEFTNTINAGSF